MAEKIIGKATVTAGAVWVWTGPTISSGRKVRTVQRGEVLEVYEQSKWWIRHNKGGWSSTLEADGTKIIDFKPDTTVTTSKKPSAPASAQKPIPTDYTPYLNNSDAKFNASKASELFLKNVRGIHGMPYQYMPSADTRLPGSTFGRKYAEKIITKMPMLLLTPGTPKFMNGYSAAEKKDIIKYALNKNTEQTLLQQLLNKDEGKFYSFKFDYQRYYSYVNPMCQSVARFLGIQNEMIDGKKLDRFQWENFTNSEMKGFISSAESVAFYIDSETQISESFSNSTGESMLSSSVNSISDMGREMQFLLGGAAGIEFDKLKKENYEASLAEFDKFTSKYTSFLPDKLMKNLTQGFMTVATGGKMIFPEIYNDSQFSRSYNINIKLRSPDADDFSWYMNIAVPLLHLIALVAPQQMGPNGFNSPFLVRGYYKGFFNCDMGIITSMNISKGDKGKWTLKGLPTEVDVSIDMKDLYQIMTITSDKSKIDLLENTILLDYLANMCGININKPDILRTIDIYYTQFTNKAIDAVTFDSFLGVRQWVSNLASSLYKK